MYSYPRIHLEIDASDFDQRKYTTRNKARYTCYRLPGYSRIYVASHEHGTAIVHKLYVRNNGSPAPQMRGFAGVSVERGLVVAVQFHKHTFSEARDEPLTSHPASCS